MPPLLLILLASPLPGGGGLPSPNQPPEFGPATPLTVVEGQRLAFLPAVSDPDGDELELSYSGWSSRPSRIAGRVGTFPWRVTARDRRGGEASQTVLVEVRAERGASRAAFELAAGDPESLPFPNDLWTVPDPAQKTGRRVALPLPPASAYSEHHLVEELNELDGFSPRPRITVPIQGGALDAASVGEDSLFLVALSEPDRGTAVAVSQRVLDAGSGPPGTQRLIATPSQTLRESSRYVLVLTNDLSAGAQPLARTTALNETLYRWEAQQAAETPFELEVFDALDALEGAGVAADEVATLVPFTTRTISSLPIALRRRLDDGSFPLAALDFDVDPWRPGLESWDADDVDAILQFLHRASAPAAGPWVAFPDGSLAVASAFGDDPEDVWLMDASSGALLHVPPSHVTAQGGVLSTNVTALGAKAGDEIALLSAQLAFDGGAPPYRFKHVGRIAFWSAPVPIYTDAAGQVPLLPSGSKSAPPQTGVETLLGILCLPDGPAPAGGFPVAGYAHGSGRTAFEDTTFVLAGPLAESGIALSAFNASGHGGGPQSFLVVSAAGGTDVALLRATGLGRSMDLDGDGVYATSEGLNILQRWSDIMAVVRSTHLGADADGLVGSDLSPLPARTYQFGISYGGQTTLGIATYDTQVGAAVANVAGTGQFGNGYLTALGASRDSAAAFLGSWSPAPLLNGSDPLYGGGFTEDVPWPGQPLQAGLVAGAEDIQWALDAQQWRDAHQMAADIMPLTASGEARGGAPMPLLLQLSRGDGVAANTLQHHFVTNGLLKSRTCLVQFDLEPAYDAQWALLGLDPGTARHMALGLPHNGDPKNPAGRIPDDLRQQLVDFLASGGGAPADPDDAPDSPYTDDVFEVPISGKSLLEIASDPGFSGP